MQNYELGAQGAPMILWNLEYMAVAEPKGLVGGFVYAKWAILMCRWRRVTLDLVIHNGAPTEYLYKNVRKGKIIPP